MPVSAPPGRLRLLRMVEVGVAGIAVGVGVTLAAHGLGGGAERPASVQRLDLPAAPAAAPVRAGSARAAVRQYLEAAADGDFAAAYGLLDQAGRRRYPSLARFTRAQADRAPVTGVRGGRERPARPGPGRGDRDPGPPGGH